MKVLLAMLLGVFGYFMVFARKLDCTNDETICRVGQCCVNNFHGIGKVCKSLGDDIGDYCGGDYFCAGCDMGLTCVPHVDNVTRPANGTCQMFVPNVPTLDDLRGMIVEELQKFLLNDCPVAPVEAPLN